VGDGVVDDEGPEQDEDKERLEAHAPCNRARDEGRGDDREHHLEERIGKEWNRRCIGACRIDRDALHHEVVEAADDACVVGTEREREADADPQGDLEADREERCQDVVHDILPAPQPAIEEGESWCHEEHQCGTEQHEGCIRIVHMKAPSLKHAH